MARGSQRRGAGSKQTRGRGAASRRTTAGPSQPPPAGTAEAAPGLHLGDSLDEVVAALRSETGRERAYAILFQRATSGYRTRDEVSALTLAKHVVDRFAKASSDRELPEKVERLEAELAEVRALAAGGGTGGARFAGEVDEPPSVDDGALPS